MRLVTAFFILMTFALTCFAQIEVKPSETTYKRAGSAPEHKKTFDVRYPVVTGIEDLKVNQENLFAPRLLANVRNVA